METVDLPRSSSIVSLKQLICLGEINCFERDYTKRLDNLHVGQEYL